MKKIGKILVASSILLGSSGLFANESEASSLTQSSYQRLAFFYEYNQPQTTQSSGLTQAEYQRLASMQ
ncbi:hypothetical protein BFS35_005905 [Macrococcoides goetzii]|uniref:Uncharacterized protein n=1 Tax=Macrococcoides goetzii TaxID=1891097 RepID=A0A395GAK4_9STAP|nr:hypothetical protein [Macrococcus goetzii]RAI81099.1 hypothetical protein BFS35_005905 [Macrococcus goetzii]